MAEGTYEYECMRAELLGIEKPDYEEFIKNHPQSIEPPGEEDVEPDNLQKAEIDNERLGRISGGLEELNSILQVTQKKLNKFKASCGSLTNLLRVKIGQGSSTDSMEVHVANGSSSSEAQPVTSGVTESRASEEPGSKSDLSRALDNHVDRLDSMIEKADNAQYSMAFQNKEMKKFLN